MENQPKKEELKIVSRPSNEEIQEDEVGDFKNSEEFLANKDHSVASDGPFSEDTPKEKNSLATASKNKNQSEN